MPPRQVRGAQSSSAQAHLASKGGAPEGLSSFLGGFVAGPVGGTDPASPLSATSQQEAEGVIAVNLRLLSKSSDTTKQKSLTELIARVGEAREDLLPPFVPSIAEAVIRHTHYPNPQVRASCYALLKTLMGRGKSVKVALVGDLAALAPEWIMAMNDMEVNVRREAREAFEATFSTEKRPAMLLKYKDDILRTLFEQITVIGLSREPLTDDQLDPRANTIFSALRALGYLVKQVSATQSATLPFLLENPAFAAVVPRSVPAKKYVAARTPLVRSAVLSLLRDVTAVCPCTPKMHQLVAEAANGSIADTDPTVAARVWELLLYWCRANVADVITYMPADFLDNIVDSFMECTRPELAEVIFPCLFPLLTQLTKDPRLAEVLDEFCGALVEKLRLLSETPNVSAQEVEITFQALMECWELHSVRKKGTAAASDSEELFTVIVTNLCSLLLAPAKRRRYESVVVRILCKSLVRTATRNEKAFKNCMSVLIGQPGAPFTVLLHDAAEPLVASYHQLRATVVGSLYATAVREGTYTRQLPPLADYVEAVVTASVAAGDTASLAAVLEGGAGAYEPTPAVKEAVVAYLVDLLRRSAADAPAAAAEKDDSSRALLAAVLAWNDAASTERLTACAREVADEDVQALLREHLLRDPSKAFDLLLAGCERSAFEDIARCAAQARESPLTPAQMESLRQAVSAGLQECLRAVKGDDAAVGRERRAAEERSEESSSSGSDTGSSEDADDASSSSGCSGSSNDGGESGEDTASQASSSPSSGSAKGKDAAAEKNAGEQTLLAVSAWCELLEQGGAIASLLQLTPERFASDFAPYFYKLTAAVAPALLPEYYLSIKALRAALAGGSDSGDSEDGNGDNSVAFDVGAALEAKVHALRTDGFHALVDRVGALLASHAVPAAARDAFAATLVRGIAEGTVPLCYQAFLHLQQVVPFATRHFLQDFVSMVCRTERFVVRRAAAGAAAGAMSERLSLFGGYFSLADMDVAMGPAVRTAQMLRVMESVASDAPAPASQRPAPSAVAQENGHSGSDAAEAARCVVYLLKAAVAKEVFSEGTCATLFNRLLPQAIARVDSSEVAAGLVAQLAGADGSQAYLLVTLAAVLRDLARSRYAASAAASSDEQVRFLLCGRRIVSAVTAAAVDALFTSSGARGIAADLAVVYTAFYSIMDEAANAVRDNMLAQLPKEKEALLTEACMMLPSWDVTTAKLALVLHRHLGSMPVVAESTVKSLLQYAQAQSPLDGLELLAELSMTRILAHPAYGEVVRVIVHSLCRCYTLRHLPTNGRLSQQQQPGVGPSAAPPLPFTQLRRIAVAAAVARRGVVIHSRADDVLRSTVNLVVFDVVCEAVSRLRSTAPAEVPQLARLIAFTSDFMSELLTSDVAVLRASEASVHKIASVLCFAYLWVSVTPIARLEAMGMETVSAVMRCVCQLANLTLVRSGMALHDAVRPILAKPPIKPLREHFSSAEPLKTLPVRRQNTLVSKTRKQRLLLFPYLLAWAVALTASAPEEDVADADRQRSFRERRQDVCTLLDLVLSLLFTPYGKQQKGVRLEDTFIGSAIGAAAASGGAAAAASEGNPFAGMLGFEVVALTRTDSAEPMAQLARGAASVFTLLLHGRTLSFVTHWIDTLERKLQALLFDFAEVYVSPTLTQENLLAVLSHSPDGGNTFSTSDEMTITVSTAQRTVTLSYEMEEAKVAVTISFPAAYPLRKPHVSSSSGKEVGISTDKWRAWMLKMTTLLFSGGNSTWDCVELFQRNLDAHLGGQEPCPICYAVVNAVNHKLPDARCSVCHNVAFHSSCLYSWWASGGQNVCPLCRAPWISE